MRLWQRENPLRKRRRISRQELYDAVSYVVELGDMPYQSRRAEVASYGIDFDELRQLIDESFDSDAERSCFAKGFLLGLRLSP